MTGLPCSHCCVAATPGPSTRAVSAPLAAVVLAGGESRRMGRDKAVMAHPESGTTMVEYVVSAVAARCSPVFVVAAPGQSLPELPGARVLRDEVRGMGPLVATGRGLRAAAEAGCERAFVCAVDMPYLNTALIDEVAAGEGADVVVPCDGAVHSPRVHYLAGVYRTALAARIEALTAEGHRSMRALTDEVRTQRVHLPPTRALLNVNTESELRG